MKIKNQMRKKFAGIRNYLMNGNTRSDFSRLFILVFLAFVIRLYFTTLHEVTSSDCIIIGKNLISGRGFVDINGNPILMGKQFYSLLIGISSLLTSNLELAAKLISVAFGSLLLVPIFLLGKRLYNKRVGYIACIFAVFYFWLVDSSAIISGESVYIFLVTCGALIGYLAMVRRINSLYFISGVIFGLCYLTRPEGFGYVGVMALFSIGVWLFAERNRLGFKRAVTNTFFLLIGFLIVSSPHFLFLHEHTGQWTLSGNGALNLIVGEGYGDRQKYELRVMGLTEDKTEIWNDYYLGKVDAMDYIKSHPLELFRRYIKNMRGLLTEDIPATFPIWLLLLVGLGLFKSSWGKTRIKKEIYVSLMILYPLLVFPVMLVSPRYLLATLPFLLIWTAKGTYELQRWFEETAPDLKIPWKSSIIVILVLLSLLPPFIAYQSYFLTDQLIEHKNAGLWLKDNAPEEQPRVMSRKGVVASYADGIPIQLPYANYTDIMAYAKHKKAEYIVIDERYIPERRPMIAYLLNESNAPGNLKLIYKNEEIPNRKILVYTILKY
ncbi:MAG: glycosyltransferase family 39 protein [Nanoarchaeota archaeon]|nr:glycosyltransferase family 39 protein [Nanoarchaeota archaeon]